jgi:4-aminobutyrate aminotransferase
MNTVAAKTTEDLLPKILTELPGPKAKALVERDSKVVSPSYTRSYPFVAERAQGCLLWDPDGNRFLDMNAGIAVCSTGHCHPEVVKAVQDQAAKLIHMSGTDFYYEIQIQLAEKIAEIVPGDFAKKSFFGNSGTEVVEGAIKLARWKTGRQHILAFYGGFHGRSMGSLSLTASKAVQRKGFAPYVAGVVHVPFPDPYRSPFTDDPSKVTEKTLRYLHDYVFTKEVEPSEFAACIVEPIQGEGGYVIPPNDFLPALAKVCSKYGILLIDDEVQCGMGRSGKMFVADHYGVVADIMVIAKGIASGMPLGVFTASEEIMSWPPGAHGNTFGGNPLACAAASKTIDLLQGGLIDNASAMGNHIMSRIADWPAKYPIVGQVRGKGLMIGVEFVRDPKTKEPAPDVQGKVVDSCFKKGVLFLACGKSAVRMAPPLVVTREQCDFALDTMEEVIKGLS